MQLFKLAIILTILASVTMHASAGGASEVLGKATQMAKNLVSPSKLKTWFKSKSTLTKTAIIAAPVAAVGVVAHHYSGNKDYNSGQTTVIYQQPWMDHKPSAPNPEPAPTQKTTSNNI